MLRESVHVRFIPVTREQATHIRLVGIFDGVTSETHVHAQTLVFCNIA